MMRVLKELVLEAQWVCNRVRWRWRGLESGSGVKLNGMPAARARRGGRIVLGDRVNINSARWANPLNNQSGSGLYAGPGAILELRSGVGVSSSQLVAHTGIVIGEDSLVGAGCLICDSDMHEVPLQSGNPTAMAPIRIGRRVFVGARSIILKGVTIGDGAVIGAGSVVSRDVPAGMLAAGNPAKVIRSVAESTAAP